MLEIIALIFVVIDIGKLAQKKGLKVLNWRIYAISAWLIAEFIGLAIGLFLLNSRDFIALQLLGLISAVGGFLIVRNILEKNPDPKTEDDIKRTSTDDLKP